MDWDKIDDFSVALERLKDVRVQYDKYNPKVLSTNFVPRPFQDSGYEKWKEAKKEIFAFQIGPGLGKTKLAAMIALSIINSGKKVIFISPNGTAIPNNIMDFLEVFAVHNQQHLVCPEVNSFNPNYSVYFFTHITFVKTKEENIIKYANFIQNCGLFVIDETQWFPEDTENEKVYIGKIPEYIKPLLKNGVKAILLTATFTRLDGMKPFGLEEADFNYCLQEGILAKYAAPIHGIQVYPEVEIKEAKQKHSKMWELRFSRKNKDKWISEIIKVYSKITNTLGSMSSCFFCSRIDDAKQIAKALNDYHGKDLYIVLTSELQMQEREPYLQKIRDGELLGFVTVGVGVEALNVPRLRVAYLLTPTSSEGRLLQETGRVTRLHEEKGFALVVDFVYAKAKVLKGAQGQWRKLNNIKTIMKASGSTIDPEGWKNGQSLFEAPKGEEIDAVFHGMTAHEKSEWISVRCQTRFKAAIEELIRRAKAGEPRPLTNSKKKVKLNNGEIVTENKEIPSIRLKNLINSIKTNNASAPKIRTSNYWFLRSYVNSLTLKDRNLIEKIYTERHRKGYTLSGTLRAKAVIAQNQFKRIRFKSIMDATRHLKVTRGNIWKCLNGERNFAGGYKWEYA